jgi:hypothetical protein
LADTYLLGVTGDRHHDDIRLIRDSLVDAVHRAPADRRLVVRHGACPGGADRITAYLLKRHRERGDVFNRPVDEDPMPADWDHCGAGCPTPGTPRHRVRKLPGDIYHPGDLPDYCPKAGPRRNTVLVVGLDELLAYPLPSSRGTRQCMRAAATLDVPVRPITRKARP